MRRKRVYASDRPLQIGFLSSAASVEERRARRLRERQFFVTFTATMRTQRGETIILETRLFECACMLFARVRCVELRILDAARLCRETEESNSDSSELRLALLLCAIQS